MGAGAESNDCILGTTCGNTGNCDGNGGCALAPQGTVCSSSCQGNVAIVQTCDGAGHCQQGSPQDCGAYACVQSVGCNSSCNNTNQDCAPSFNCNPNKTCTDCTSCGDWLAGTAALGLCNGPSCQFYDNLVNDCCQPAVCQSACAQNALDLCAGPNNGCFSTQLSMECKTCLLSDPSCNGDLNACEVDNGH